MIIEHIAIWTPNIEKLRSYYMEYFEATSNEKYINKQKQFESYFLSFDNGARLEIMQMTGVPQNQNDRIVSQHEGIIHIAFAMPTKEDVDKKAEELELNGYRILSGPRTTGDGYYEFETLDPDNNRIEVTMASH